MELLNELRAEVRDEALEQVSVCPLQDVVEQRAVLAADDELVFPKHKRVFAQYTTNEVGATELHLHYGEKEISFDEPELFDFGEELMKQPRFVAGSATAWGRGYEWPRVRELLEQLIDEGILRLVQPGEPEIPVLRELSRPSPLPPAVCKVPRTWLDAEAITLDLTGHSIELSYLELVLPVYRIPHVAMDADGRQVGEANVFPKALRLDVPTDWRTCPHVGSRYQEDRPMNVTALKVMRVHWKQMMVALLRVREAYLQRFPQARNGWTVGDLHCLAALVLSIPSYVMLRAENRVENGQLHPVLSSMYRVTDGVRMVMHHMLFSEDLESTLPLHAPMTSTELYAYAERNGIFISDHGVCAGPRAMIEEFLRVLLDGQPIEGAESVVLADPVEAALSDLDAIFDYVLLGLKAYAVVFSRWPTMTRAYEELFDAVATWSGPETLQRFQEQLQRSVHFLKTATRQNTEERRLKRERVYADMYARSVRALGESPETQPLWERIAPVPVGNDAVAKDRLEILLQQHLDGVAGVDGSAIEHVADVLMGYFRQEQAIVREGSAIQQRINRLLGRAPPTRALTGSDLAIHYRLLASIYLPEQLADVGGRLPYFVDEIEEGLGLDVTITGESIELH